MPSRSRNRILFPNFHPGGSAQPLQAGLSPQTGVARPYLRENMSDFVGNRAYTNPLTLHQDDWCIGWFSGKNSNFWNCESWNCALDAGALSSNPSLPNLTDAVAATMALARTNPSRPIVDVWTFLYELKDIPQMVLQAGQLLRKYGNNARLSQRFLRDTDKDIANFFLAYQFGWEQFYRDLLKLFDFVGDVQKRTKQLDDLSAGDLRLTSTVLDATWSPVDSAGMYVGPLYQAVTSILTSWKLDRKIWVRIRYKPTAQTFKYLGTDHHAAARRISYALDGPDWDTIWNMIPWSWLLDWFSTAGDYFAANRNRLGVQVDDVAVMRRTEMKLTGVKLVNPFPNSSFKTNPHAFWTQKYRSRYVGGPVINAYVPYLEPKQWLILAALGAKYAPFYQ